MVGRRGGWGTSGRGVGVDGGGVGVGVLVVGGCLGVPVGKGGVPVSMGASGVSDDVGVSVSVGVGVSGTVQPSVVWHLEHWPRGWLAGRSWEWQALQFVYPVWLKTYSPQALVSWQSLHSPGQCPSGAWWQVEHSGYAL
jgi:hypothetical protein